jgi:hypothetical protein
MGSQFLGLVFVTGLRHNASQTKQIINYFIFFLPFQNYKTVTEYILIYCALGVKCIGLFLITVSDTMTTKFYIWLFLTLFYLFSEIWPSYREPGTQCVRNRFVCCALGCRVSAAGVEHSKHNVTKVILHL